MLNSLRGWSVLDELLKLKSDTAQLVARWSQWLESRTVDSRSSVRLPPDIAGLFLRQMTVLWRVNYLGVWCDSAFYPSRVANQNRVLASAGVKAGKSSDRYSR